MRMIKNKEMIRLSVLVCDSVHLSFDGLSSNYLWIVQAFVLHVLVKMYVVVDEDKYALIIAQFCVQYDHGFLSFSYFADLFQDSLGD